MATSWTLGPAGVKDRVRSRFGVKANTVGVQVFGTMIPSETCFATPSAQKKDEFGLPCLEVCIRFSDSAIDNIVRARQHLMNVMDEAGCHATIGEIAPTLFPGTSAHYGGSARMHAKPQYGVVDSWNRIHRAPNVLVCDASCFTTAVEKHPTLTVMALALRAAARLSDDLKHS
jgi:choline dehydrogenase-like flavoprotein